MAITIDNIPKKLLQAIRKNELVIFVGAGLSWNLKNKNDQQIKGWNDLIREIIYHVTCNEEYDLSHLTSLIGKYDPIKILELIEDDCSKNKSLRKEISLFTKNFFDLHDTNNYDLHKNLFKLSNKIITTNYDTAFEIAVPELRKYKGYKGKLNELGNHTDPILPLLFKLHGCFEDINSMVLFPSDYKKLYNDKSFNAQNALFVLGNIITNKTILFIGTGMGDFQINNIFQRIKKLQADNIREHFIITKTYDKSLDFITPIKINDFNEINTIINLLIEEKTVYASIKTPREIQLEEELQVVKTLLEESDKKVLHMTDKTAILEESIMKAALEYYSIGLNYNLEENYEKAIKYYKKAIKIDNTNSLIYYNIGNSLQSLADINNDEKLYQEAIEYCLKGISFNQLKDTGLNKIGEIYHDLGELKNDNNYYLKAIDYYKQAITINPDSYYYNNLGITFYELAGLGEEEYYYYEAINAYETAINIKPDSDYYDNLGFLLSKLAALKNDINLYKKAIQAYQEAIQLEPTNDNLYNSLGNIYNEIENFREAIKYYEEALKLNSFDNIYYYNAGHTYYEIAGEEENEETRKKLYIKAIKFFEKAITIDPDNKDDELYNYLGLALHELAIIADGTNSVAGLYNRAIKNFQKAIEINSTEGYYYYNIALVLYELAQIKKTEQLYEEAIKYYDIFINMYPNEIDSEVYNQKGLAYYELANLKENKELQEEAIKNFYKAIQLNPNECILYENIGMAFFDLHIITNEENFLIESLKLFEKSVELGGNSFEMANIYISFENKEKAIFYLEESLKRKEINTQEIKNNIDWAEYLEDDDFKALLKKYEQ